MSVRLHWKDLKGPLIGTDHSTLVMIYDWLPDVMTHPP